MIEGRFCGEGYAGSRGEGFENAADLSSMCLCLEGNFLTGIFDQIKDVADGATKGITEGVGSLTSPGKGGDAADSAEPKDFFSGIMSGITDAAAGAEKAAREV